MTDQPDTEIAEDEEVIDEVGRAPARRHDAARPNAAPKRQAAQAKQRHDSDAEIAIDGWGEPFRIECAPGWRAFFVSEYDAVRLSWRPWVMATWGDVRIISYNGTKRGDAGTPMKFNELTVYLMREEDFTTTQARDPRRRAHSQLREVLFRRAEESGQVDPVSGHRIAGASTGFALHHQR